MPGLAATGVTAGCGRAGAGPDRALTRRRCRATGAMPADSGLPGRAGSRRQAWCKGGPRARGAWAVPAAIGAAAGAMTCAIAAGTTYQPSACGNAIGPAPHAAVQQVAALPGAPGVPPAGSRPSSVVELVAGCACAERQMADEVGSCAAARTWCSMATCWVTIWDQRASSTIAAGPYRRSIFRSCRGTTRRTVAGRGRSVVGSGQVTTGFQLGGRCRSDGPNPCVAGDS